MMDFEVLEPVLNGDTPMWLVRRWQKQGRIGQEVSKEGVQNALKKNRPLKDVAVYEVRLPYLFQCLKCGAVIEGNGSQPLECYRDQEGCGRRTAFLQITGGINPDLWRLPRWKDIPVDDLDIPQVYEDALELVKKALIFSSEIEYKIYVLWAFSTWKLEAWDAVGFPVFVGISDSGKSRALRVLHYLAYRASKSSGLTHAVIPRLCHYHNATLLIDEAHSKLNPRTEAGGQTLDFVKDSYKRGSVYHVCDKEDQSAIRTYRNFGFKAIAGERSFNPALVSRSLVFWMDKAEPEIAKLSYLEAELDGLRTHLLNYRLKTSDPPDLGNDFVLKGRTREIFESIIATGRHIGIDVEDVIEYAQERDKRAQESLKDTEQYDILVAIKKAQEQPLSNEEIDRIHIDSILNDLGWLTGEREPDNKARRRIGYILKDMGLERKRTREGRVVVFEDNMDRLKALYRRYEL
ncbi:MAG: hypothetical protein PHU95_01175 [Candidatus Thermoplasmatota archaeon]|nr:hypothetical protein [Candidatus Thermoplasmatota archaeon]MDD5778047.1 hypothetical protein [Candidatus Thermoplasmatota archaeon]